MGLIWSCDECEHANFWFQDYCVQCLKERHDGPTKDDLLQAVTLYNISDRDVPLTAENFSNHAASAKFYDNDFPPNMHSINDTRRKTKLNWKYTHHSWQVSRWLSPEYISWKLQDSYWPLTVLNAPHSADIVQGQLGDCWLIAALSLITEVPSILYKIMVTKQYNPKGMYQVQLCDRGIWKVLTIDDKLPVNKYNSFVFTYAKRRQLFASLIEKAFAKLHGNYNALRSGRCDEGLQALTGEPTQVVFLRSSSGNSTNYDDIWKKMLQAKRKGHLMTCPASNSRISDRTFDKNGIESNHAYSVLDVTYASNGQRLVTLRNPWGSLKKTNFGLANDDGVLVLNFNDMPQFFSSVSICKFNPSWTEVRKQGQFGALNSTIESVYALDVRTPMQLEIELFNAGDGWYYNRRQDPDVDLCLIVQKDGKVISYRHDVDYYICYSGDMIKPGIYFVYALSFATLHHNVFPVFNIVFHGSNAFTVHERQVGPEILSSLFHGVAFLQNNSHPLSREATIRTFNDNGNFGMVIENRYRQPIRIQSDFRGTKNVLSSRFSNFCIDVIPPFSRALIVLFTRRVYNGNVLISYKSKAQKVNFAIPEAHHPPLNKKNLFLHRPLKIY